MIFKLFKMIFGLILGLVLLLIVGGVFFLNLSPEFGGKAGSQQKTKYASSGHYEEDKFVNLIPTNLGVKLSEYPGLFIDMMKGVPHGEPEGSIPVQQLDSATIAPSNDKPARLTWFGHSAVLLELDGKNIFLDPMLGNSPSPVSFFGSKRFSELPIEIEKLPHLDAVIISHDHYDHLDYGSIRKLKDKVDAFYVPLGVGAHLISWGVAEEKVHELNWWDEVKHDDFTFVCAPARHFSGRGLFDRDHTLWSSWVIQSPNLKLFFSGDSGYGPHFKEIGERIGPFDFAMLECGQYDTRWQDIHMLPEQTVQAAIDVQSKTMMPIHWGAFTLAMHSWTDPIERATDKAKELGVSIATPVIGEAVLLPQKHYPDSEWWEGVDAAQ